MSKRRLEKPPGIIRVTQFAWNNEGQDWQPVDPQCLMEWASVDVGDRGGSVYYQVHICTHAAMPLLENKRHVFSIESYASPTDLILQLDAFIAEKADAFSGDPFRELAHFWKSEYGVYDSRENLIG